MITDAISWLPGLGMLLAALVFVWLAYRLSRGFLSPVVIYGTIWLGTIAAFLLPIIAYTSVSVQTWFAIGVSFIAFVSGCAIATRGKAQNLTAASQARHSRIVLRQDRLEIVIVVLAVLGAIGLAGYLRAINETAGLANFATSPHLIRQAQETEAYLRIFGFAKFLNYFNFALFPLLVFYFVVLRGSARRLMVLLCVPATLSVVLSLDRTQPFFVIVWSAAIYLLLIGDTSIGRRRIAWFAACFTLLALIFFGVASYIGKTAENNPALRAASRVPAELAPVLLPYSYLTATIPALDKYLEVNSPGVYRGAFTLLPITKLAASALHVQSLPPEIGPFYDVPFSFNAFTYLNVYYSDFGLPGVVVGPFVLGAISSAMYARVRAAPSFLNIYIYGLLSYVLVLSIFANKLVSTFVWEMALVGLSVGWYCTRNPLRPTRPRFMPKPQLRNPP